jgi:cytochrome P450
MNQPPAVEAAAPPIDQSPSAPMEMLLYLNDAWREQGDAFEVTLNGLRSIVVAHPRDIRRVLTDRNYTEKGPLYEGIRQVLGDGVLTSGGERWRDSRKIMAPAFQRSYVDGATRAITDTGSAFVDELRKNADGGTIDVQEAMTGLTLRSLVAAMFGDKAHTAVSRLTYPELTAAFDLASEIGGMPFSQTTPLTYEHVRHNLVTVAQDMIDVARADEPDNTLLSLLAHTKDEVDNYLDDQAIRDELLTITFGGHETTALSLTWLFQLLDGRDDVRDRVRHEVQTVLSDGRVPTVEDIPELVYTRQVIDEVMRLHPPVPLIARTAQNNQVLGGATINGGDMAVPFIAGAHRHPNFWRNPEEFDPDRFSAEQSAGRDKWSYLPFAAGNRICAGRGFALAELVLHTAVIMNHLDLRITDQAEPQARLTLRPSRPMHAQVRPVMKGIV